MKLILQAIKALFRKIEASRTHWEEVKEVSVVAETTVTISKDMGSSESLSYTTTQLKVGQTYFVILNGVSYECVAWYSDAVDGVIIGNGVIYGGEGGGNGEPFSCDSYLRGDIYLNTEKAGTYTISISTKENVIHKLDKKYLPDEIIDGIDIAQSTANDAISTANSKMDANNPVGTGSFSMGRKSGSVVGNYSHAEGSYTTASGDDSHAEGYYTTASGHYSHAEGFRTTASGSYSHAEGQITTALGVNSHAEGINTTASGKFSHAEGDSTYEFSEVVTTTNPTNDDIRAAWINKKFSVSKGISSHVEGKDSLALGDYSHAEGDSTTASGQSSHSEGSSTTASGNFSHAEGSGTTALGTNSYAGGFRTTASGTYSHAEGESTHKFSDVVTTTNPTNADIITAWKSNKFSLAKGNSSHVEGQNNLALRDYSHAEGVSTTASGSQSHAEGGSTTASGASSHAEGINTKASGDYSHAEGGRTTASGNDSHAEGVNTEAFGTCSHAEGSNTTASGVGSHAEGLFTKASKDYQHAQGKYNIEDSAGTYADIIGNGTTESNRSNAATVDWSGNAWYAGDVYVGSTSGTNKDAGSKKLATEEYVDSKQVQSDYEQNDSDAADYIKNRPFYSSGITEVTLLDGTFDFAENPDTGLYLYSEESSAIFEELKTYTVLFDGTSYSCIGYIPMEGSPVLLGNASLLGVSGGNNEPFLMLTADSHLVIYTNSTDASHTVKIIDPRETIKKLDEKYLPDEIRKTPSSKMDKINPTGTGSFSLNREVSTTIGNYSFAEGYCTTASAHSSHAEGDNTTASAHASHAEGIGTTASGNQSHAEGSNTTASGSYSHAEGAVTTASGNFSHAEGRNTTASGVYQHAQGKYNIEDSTGTYADIIGNGTSSKRSNAATVDWSGNAWYAGDVYVGSTSGTNKDSGSKKLATEEYVDNSTASIEIPTTLPNPNALTIKIGSTAVTYDGSKAQTVTIDDGTEVSY